MEVPAFVRIPPRMERVEVVTGGRGWVVIGDQEAEVTAGAVLWHHEGDQTISRSDPEAPYRCLNAVFQAPRNRGRRRVPRLTWWRDLEAIEAFITETVRAYVDDRFERHALLAYTYGRLLFQARLWEQTSGRSRLPEKLRQALELIEQRPASLRDLARHVGWSVAHLHEVCRETLQATPHELALRHYMKIARERLAGSDRPLKQIATECGFSSASAFCHAFKHRLGLTPLEYRKLNQRH
ncbi:MAG: helix-turn-helix domain-containing protein [Chthoniobacteraceae bacterium]